MSLTVKHLNDDASFLLTFRPEDSFSSDAASSDFTIVLDPWLVGESTIFHSKFSITKPKEESCIRSLLELPEPDLVIVSQDKTDHCHAATLKTLSPCPSKTIVLAEPASARMIRGWKHFGPNIVQTLPRWEEKRLDTIRRIPIKPLDQGGLPGEVTVAFVAQKLDMTALHSAVCITYRPPTRSSPSTYQLPPTPPASPGLEGVQLTQTNAPRTLSVIFSPHGIEYSSLQPFVTSHLVLASALPLTALLHCFDRISNPWYLGGNICAGMPGGAEIVQRLCAKAWISAHDGDKETTGIATTKIVKTSYDRQSIEATVGTRNNQHSQGRLGTEIVVLGSGEQMVFGSQPLTM